MLISIIVNTSPPTALFLSTNSRAMGATLLEVESRQLKEFSQWSSTPPYAAIAFLGHLGLDTDWTSPRNDIRLSQRMSEKPELWKLDVVCDLVRDRELQYLWLDDWCPVLDSSGLSSNRPEHLEACYEHARWCLVLMPAPLYRHFQWHLHPDGEIPGCPRILHDQQSPLELLIASRKGCFAPRYGTMDGRFLPSLNHMVWSLFRMNATRLQDCISMGENSGASTLAVNATSSNGLSRMTKSQLSLIILQDNLDSHCCIGEGILGRSFQEDHIIVREKPLCLGLEASRKHYRQQWSLPSSPHCKHPATGHFAPHSQQGQHVLSHMGFHGQKESSDAFRSQIQKSIAEESKDIKQHESYHLYPSTGQQTYFQPLPTPHAQSQTLNTLRTKQQAKAPLPTVTPGTPIATASSVLLGYRFKSCEYVDFNNARSWIGSKHDHQITEEGSELSEPLPTMHPVHVGGNDTEDIEGRRSEITSKTECQWQCLDEWAQLAPSLGPSHPLTLVKDTLVHIALSKYLDQKKQQQRYISCRRRRAPESSSNRERLEIACPFYKVDSFKYSSCLKDARLLTISQVKDHLLQQHRMPFYCPVCKSDFQTAASRDRHVVKRACNLKEEFPHEGVSDDQRRLLLRRHRRMGLKQHWHKICVLLQLDISVSASPYLIDTTAVANEVVGFRDFWRKYGQGCIADFLTTTNLHQWNRRNEERDLACFYSEILEGVSETLIRWHNTEREFRRISSK